MPTCADTQDSSYLNDPQEFDELVEKCKVFQNKEGPVLQRYLHLKSWINKNYVSDWWLR